MGRKLIRRMPTEKDKSNKIQKGHIAIIVAQHVLLYSSGYVIASTAYLIHTGIITNDLLPAAVILVFAVSLYEVGRHVS
jgi:ABC-type transport system involved in cytochrome bd biosynthesis fused ATPase/permease subunit